MRLRPAKTVISAICAPRRLGLDHGHRLLDPEPLQVRRHRHVVVAGLHDDQRRLERAQVDPGDLGGDRALPAEAGVDVAGPGHPVHEGVPAQLAGQQHGPGPGRILRPHPRGERRADDRDGRHAGPPAGLKPLLAPGQRRGLARPFLGRPCAGGRRGGDEAGERDPTVAWAEVTGSRTRNPTAAAAASRRKPRQATAKSRRCRRPCQTAGWQAFRATRRVSDRDVAASRRHA